jgi:hypothetical protein
MRTEPTLALVLANAYTLPFFAASKPDPPRRYNTTPNIAPA